MQEEPKQRARPRNISAIRQLFELFTTDLGRLLRERRTVWLATIQLLPIVAAILLVNWMQLDGLSIYTGVVEQAIFPFLLPLVAIFYGGPVIVDEIERKTLTYLTLRPIPKSVIFLAKWAAGATIAIGLVSGTLLLLYLVCIVFGGGFGSSGVPLFKTLLAAVSGTAAYGALFAALGALFGRGLIASVIYFLVFDLVMGQIPVLKLGTVRFHLYNIGDFQQTGGSEILDTFLSGGGISVPWWLSTFIAVGFGLVALLAGALIFARRQYTL